MADARRVLITGASRGLGLATAAHLHDRGWSVVGGMRSPEEGLDRLRTATNASPGDPRLSAVALDLAEPASITAAAAELRGTGGALHGIVHNAGVAAVGATEELPDDVWGQLFTTNLFGPIRLTRALLPDLRAAGRGRIVLVSSMGAVRGMPGIAAYSAAKGAVERWGESMAFEIAPFGLGVTVLVAGTFRTDILELTPTYGDPAGPYGTFHAELEGTGRRFVRLAAAPERFAPAVAAALEDERPFVRRSVGVDAHLLRFGTRLLPAAVLHRLTASALRLPGPRTLVGDRQQTAAVASTGESSPAEA